MVERKFSVHEQSQAKSVTLLKKHSTVEVATIDDADSITIDIMTTIDNAKMINLVDGSDVAVTIATNVITVNDVAAVGIPVIVLVVGT